MRVALVASLALLLAAAPAVRADGIVLTEEAGNVTGPTSSTDNRVVTMDGTAGNIQETLCVIDDNGKLSVGDPDTGTQTLFEMRGSGGKSYGFDYNPSAQNLKMVRDGAVDSTLFFKIGTSAGSGEIKWDIFRSDSYQPISASAVVASVSIPMNVVHANYFRGSNAADVRYSHGIPDPVTLGAAATSIDPANDAGFIELTGDAGGNTISTIVSTGFNEGDRLVITVADLGGGISLTDTASPAANQLAMNGNATLTIDSVVVFQLTIRAATYWQEVSRSLN